MYILIPILIMSVKLRNKGTSKSLTWDLWRKLQRDTVTVSKYQKTDESDNAFCCCQMFRNQRKSVFFFNIKCFKN